MSLQVFYRLFSLTLTDLQIKPEAENEFYKKEAKDMVNIVQRLISEGKFQKIYS